MSIGAVVFLTFPAELAGLFTADPAVVAAAVPMLRIAAMFQLSDGAQAIGAGVLRGAGDTRAAFVANVIGHYAIGLPVSLGLAFGLGWGASGLWWGLTAGLTGTAIGLVLRFWRITSRPIARA
jgi:MATE family multidrug resistance protein